MRTFTQKLLILCLLLAPSLSFGQSPANNLDFESWTSTALGPTPTGYFTYEGEENTTDPQSGGSALKINTAYEGSFFSDTIGYSSGSGAYTKRPDSVSAYFRYQLPNQDTGLFQVILTHYNASQDSTHTVATTAILFPNALYPVDTLSSWTELTLPFSYDTCATPDSIRVLAASETNWLDGIGTTTIGGNLEVDNMSLNEPEPKITNITTSDVVCNTGAKGSIDITAENVDSCTMYSIDGGATYNTDQTSYTGLDSGMYEVIAMTANGSDTMMATIDSVIQQTVDSVYVDPATCGSNDGKMEIFPSGGTKPYEYQVDGNGFQPDSNFTGLSSGKHYIDVKDNSGCVREDSVVIGTDANYIKDVAIEHESCGKADGWIKIDTVITGTDYEFSIDGGNNYYSDSSVFMNLSAGSYDVVVRGKSTGCIDDTTVTLNNEAAPTLDNVNVTDVTCGMSDGEVTISASGGSGSLEYKFGSMGYQSSNTFTGLSAGDYDAMVRDTNMCEDVMMNVTVDTALVPEVTTAASNKDTVDLANSGDVDFSSTGSGNSYDWKFGDGNTGSGQNVTHTYGSTGTYTAKVYYHAGNCVDSASVTVEVINTTSIEDREEAQNAFSIRPNPTDGRFQVEMDQVRNGRIEVMDLTGRKVHEASVNGSQARMDLSGQEDGVYFVRVIGEEGSTVSVKRLVLSH